MYSLSMEIMSFFSFQIRWVQWNPYFTYLLTRLSSLWYCNYPHYFMQRNYKENSQTFRRYMWSLFFKHYCSYLYSSCMLLHQPLFTGFPSIHCWWHWFFFFFKFWNKSHYRPRVKFRSLWISIVRKLMNEEMMSAPLSGMWRVKGICSLTKKYLVRYSGTGNFLSNISHLGTWSSAVLG